jgi:hypothetical protein
MNYEFYFLRKTRPDNPEILRVIAPTYENAAAIVARQCGCAPAPGRNGQQGEPVDIRPIEIQNIFERNVSSAVLR